MLLAPYRELTVSHDLCRKYAFYAFVECLLHLLALGFVSEMALIGLFLLGHVAKHTHGVYHCIVVVGDMYLVVAHLGPELWPSSIVVLSIEQIGYTVAECIAITFVFGLLVQTCQKDQLGVCGSVVGSGVVLSLFVSQDSGLLFVRQGLRHIDVFGPPTRYPLIEQNLVAHSSCLIALEELW